MPCFSPLDGWRSLTLNPNGKRSIVFDIHEGFHDRPVTVPCGQCVGCRLEKSRQWAMRCVHEASLYEENSFITLTYDDESLPAGGSLDKRAFPKFMKRLRKKFSSRRIRFYHAGEYGDRFGRPHYHALLFGFDFPDKYPYAMRAEFPVCRSDILESLWPFGHSEIGSVTFDSAAYVARYVMKKVTGVKAEEYYAGAQPEYSTMSRRPGIGKQWYDDFKSEVYSSDSVVISGKLVKPPRFYDGQYEVQNPREMAAIKARRRAGHKYDEQRSSRLLVRREVFEANLKIKAQS